jgi:hypothetical protein
MLGIAYSRPARALFAEAGYRPQAGLPEGIDKRTTAAAGKVEYSLYLLRYSLPDCIRYSHGLPLEDDPQRNPDSGAEGEVKHVAEQVVIIPLGILPNLLCCFAVHSFPFYTSMI